MTLPGIWSQRDARWSNDILGNNPSAPWILYNYGLMPVVVAVGRAKAASAQVLLLNLSNATRFTGVGFTGYTNVFHLHGSNKVIFTDPTSSLKADVIIPMVLSMRLRRWKQEQVINVIVELIAVQVMNLLRSLKLTANMLLHNVTVLVNLLSVYANFPVTMLRFGATFITRMINSIVSLYLTLVKRTHSILSSALLGTVLKIIKSVWSNKDHFAALLARKFFAAFDLSFVHTSNYTLGVQI